MYRDTAPDSATPDRDLRNLRDLPERDFPALGVPEFGAPDGGAPDDALLVRPYVAPSGRPRRPLPPTAPLWPQSGPALAPRPVDAPAGDPARACVRGPAGASVRAPEPRAVPVGPPEPRTRSRLPVAVLALLALAAVGGLVVLLDTPDPQPPRATAPPGLSVPVLPARSPGADTEPSPEEPAGPAASPESGSASPERPASASPGRDAGPGPTPSGSSARPPAGAPATLRPGDRGPEVRDLQLRLYGQGFTYVTATGVYDEPTRRGVLQLQQNRSIKGDPPGVYGPATRAAFGGTVPAGG
ncbi:peptidoglycan-binding protein [Streptomyces sp. NPDC091268]|uniref:peptidoglycan-binding protein n=1 Tax=Streptomyces sp. NPDC091268 TaxID=3365979 RepID=UPI0037F9A750